MKNPASRAIRATRCGSVHTDLFPELLEPRMLMAVDIAPTVPYRTYDGSGNNLQHPTWASANTALSRLTNAAYADGRSMPAGATRPSARAISNATAEHPEDELLSSKHLAAFAYLWGQFIDHDLDLTTSASPREAFNIAVPTGDPSFDPNSTGTQIIPLSRSKYVTGTGVTGPRQQVNDITSYLDGSMIYGSDEARALALRTLSGGLMKTSAGGLLPFNTLGLPNANDTHQFPDDQLFLAGDVRANENIELTSIQTLFVREHNRLATQIAQQHPSWNDEQIYQRARRLVIGEVQAITYNEFLPALIGDGALSRYTGYKSGVNASVSTEFSTAAFRLGHSMLADDVEFLDNDANDVEEEIPLAEAFFNPAKVSEVGLDPILKYLASSNSEETDVYVVDGLRNFLFGQPGQGGLDLASLNIQRGRDHGLGSYNDVRAQLGLGRVTSWRQITSDVDVQNALKSVYASVNDVDLWVGGLAEAHVRDSTVGPTFQRILVDQFTRTRDGDRFWYERDLSGSELQMVRSTQLADVIKRNSDLTNIQPNAFVFNAAVTGRVFFDRNGDGQPGFREAGVGGAAIQIVDEDGAVVATTATRSDGRYTIEGLQVGDYDVRIVLQNGWTLTTPASALADITRGGTLGNYNFGVRFAGGPTGGGPHVVYGSDESPTVDLTSDTGGGGLDDLKSL